MTHYFLSQGGSKNHYRVAKFDPDSMQPCIDHDGMHSVYNIRKATNWVSEKPDWVCDCPSYKRCKHIAWVEQWLKDHDGKVGMFYDDEEAEFFQSPLAFDELEGLLDATTTN